MASPVLSMVGHKDTQYTKIFVGGLPYLTTDQTLREYFDRFGEIEEAVVITDRQTGKSRGYGFVTMADRMSAERACKDPNPIIDGRKANVNLAYLGAKPRQNGFTGILPYTIKSFPGILPSQYGYPTQYVFPSSYLNTPSPTSPRLLAPLPATSPFSPSQTGTPTQYEFDYTSAYAAAASAQFAGYDMYSPYAASTSPASYGIGYPACYTYSTLQQPMTASSAPFHQFQPQPIQEGL